MKEPRYFVWRYADNAPYQAFGTRKYFLPDANDPNCIWRGDDWQEALQVRKRANRKLQKEKREMMHALKLAAESRALEEAGQERLL